MTYILIFNSVHRVMRAEKLLRTGGVESKTIPVPRKLSSDCGLAIRVAGRDLSAIADALSAEPAEQIFLQESDGFTRVGP